MCCFSGPVEVVQGTRIFARMVALGRQALVYQMRLAAAADVAMILPIPVPRGAGEDAVRFVSLDGYDAFFDDVQRAFPAPAVVPAARAAPVAFAAPTLVVHEVGAFVASFVPSLGDFARLDARFRVPPGTIDTIPLYADWGFAVFQLAAAAGTRPVHPMAFEFPTRRPQHLFFPAVHVHDGALHATARFDHTLYGQGVTEDGWWASGIALGRTVDVARARGLVDGDAPVSMRSLRGELPNADVWAATGAG